jgi:hypothetical protein
MHMACARISPTLWPEQTRFNGRSAGVWEMKLTDSIPVHDEQGSWHLVDEFTAYDTDGRKVGRVYRRGEGEVKRVSEREFRDLGTGEVLKRVERKMA